jgi:hypothetical protein
LAQSHQQPLLLGVSKRHRRIVALRWDCVAHSTVRRWAETQLRGASG